MEFPGHGLGHGLPLAMDLAMAWPWLGLDHGLGQGHAQICIKYAYIWGTHAEVWMELRGNARIFGQHMQKYEWN